MRKESGLKVTLPDNDVIESTHCVQLPTPQPLPQTATKTSILPKLTSSSLVSLPQLCDHGCECLLKSRGLHVVKEGNFVLKNNKGIQVLYGARNQFDRLFNLGA